MSRFFVEHVDCGVTDGGIACGPVEGAVCTTIRYRKDDEKSRWLSLDEFDGLATFYINDDDPFERHMNMNPDNEQELKEFHDSIIETFEGVPLSSDYDEVFDQICDKQKDNPASRLISYLIYVTRCPNEELEDAKRIAEGKYIDEVNFPASDIELEYCEDMM